MEKVLLTVKDVAEMTSLGTTSIWAAIRSGRLESVRVGTARRVPAEAIHAFVESLRAEARD